MARILSPVTLEEACAALREAEGDATVLGGGTALQMVRRRGEFSFGTLVDLRRIDGLDRIERHDGGLAIGALVTHRRVELDPLVRNIAPVLAEVASEIANVRVRNAATIGGNLAHRDPRLDPPGALLILGAQLDVVSPQGRRAVAVGDFFTGFGQTVLGSADVIERIRFPGPPPRTRFAFTKYKSLGRNDWPCAAVAAALTAGHDGSPECVALGLTAVAPTPMRLELDIAGLPLVEVLHKADTAVEEAIEPFSDLRGGAAFKRRVTRVIVQDTVRRLWEGER